MKFHQIIKENKQIQNATGRPKAHAKDDWADSRLLWR